MACAASSRGATSRFSGRAGVGALGGWASSEEKAADGVGREEGAYLWELWTVVAVQVWGQALTVG